MRADHRAGALAVEVEVADVELLPGSIEIGLRVRVDGAGETVFGVVGDGESVGEVGRAQDGEEGAEDLFLSEAGGRGDVGKDGGLD